MASLSTVAEVITDDLTRRSLVDREKYGEIHQRILALLMAMNLVDAYRVPAIIDLRALADYLANAPEHEAGELAEIGLNNQQSEKLLSAFYAIGPKERLELTMKEKAFHQWIRLELGQ